MGATAGDETTPGPGRAVTDAPELGGGQRQELVDELYADLQGMWSIWFVDS